MKDATIRKAKIKDLDEVSRLAVKLLKYHERFDKYHTPSKDAKKAFYKYFKAAVYSAKKELLVAEKNDNIIGFALGEIKKAPPVLKVKEYGLIDTIYILPYYRKKKLAKKFLEWLFLWFKSKKMKYVNLYVHPKNQIGLKAWEKYGFKDSLIEKRRLLRIS